MKTIKKQIRSNIELFEKLQTLRLQVITAETVLPIEDDYDAELLAKSLKLVQLYLQDENEFLQVRLADLIDEDPAPNASDWTKQGDNK